MLHRGATAHEPTEAPVANRHRPSVRRDLICPPFESSNDQCCLVSVIAGCNLDRVRGRWWRGHWRCFMHTVVPRPDVSPRGRLRAVRATRARRGVADQHALGVCVSTSAHGFTQWAAMKRQAIVTQLRVFIVRNEDVVCNCDVVQSHLRVCQEDSLGFVCGNEWQGNTPPVCGGIPAPQTTVVAH